MKRINSVPYLAIVYRVVFLMADTDLGVHRDAQQDTSSTLCDGNTTRALTDRSMTSLFHQLNTLTLAASSSRARFIPRLSSPPL